MRDALTALWSAIIVVITGVEKFAQAFSAIGDVAENTATDFRDEERIHSQIRKSKLQAEYADILSQLEDK